MKHDRSMIAAAHRVPVVSAPYPFYARAPQSFDMLEGASLAEIVARAQPPSWFWDYGRVELIEMDVDGSAISRTEVPNHLWARTVPRVSRGARILIALRGPRLEGGGGGGNKKNVGMLLATVAIVALSFAVSAGALNGVLPGILQGTTLGVANAKLAGAAIGIIGFGVLAALSKPPVLPNTPTPKTPGQPNTATLQANVLSANAPLPYVAGIKRIAPPALCEPLVEDVGDDQYAECLFAMAGPHKIWDPRADLTPLSRIPNTQVFTRAARPNDSLFRGFKDVHFDDSAITKNARLLRYGHTESPNITLSQHDVDREVNDQAAGPWGKFRYYLLRTKGAPRISCPHWHEMSLRIAADETWLTFNAPAGWYTIPQLTRQDISIPIRIRMRPVTATGTVGTWRYLPELHYSRNTQESFNFTVKLMWNRPSARQAKLVVPPTVGTTGFCNIYTSVPSCSYATPDVIADDLDGWRADPSFYRNNRNLSRLYSATTFRTTNIKNCRAFKDRVELFLDPRTFPRGAWQVEIIRGVEFATSEFVASRYELHGAVNTFFGYHPTIPDTVRGTKVRLGTDGPFVVKNDADDRALFSQTAITRVTSVINQQPSPSRNVALLAVRVKNRNLGTITAKCGALVPDWNGSNWVGRDVSSNPAAQARNLLTGSLNLTAIPEDSLNNTDFVQFRSFCNSNGHQVNGELTGQTVLDAVQMCLGCGYGGLRNAETFGVMWDRDRNAEGVSGPSITPRSSRQFQATKDFKALAKGLRVIYHDATNHDLDAVTYVYADGINSSADIEEVHYEGFNNLAAARARAKYDLRLPRYRATYYKFNVPIHHIYWRKGDLVQVNHDVLDSNHTSARLLSKTVNGSNKITDITVDNPLTDAALDPDDISGISDFPTGRFGLRIDLKDGAATSASTARLSSDGLTATFTTPIDDDADIVAGCLVVAGAVNRETRRVIIDQIDPKDDSTADVTCVAEANELFAA